jgi:hypothetical protein
MPVTIEQAQAFMEDRTKTADDVGMIPYFGLHIGGGGSGKTTALGSLPSPILIIQADGQTGSLPLKDRNDIHVTEVHSWTEVQMVMRFLVDGKHPFKSIAVDKFLRSISNVCNCHVAVTVLENIIFDQDGTPRGAFPDLKGGFRDKISPMFDTVVYHRSKQLPPAENQEFGDMVFACLTQPYTINEIPRDLARCRWDCLEIMEPMNKPPADQTSPWGIETWIERAYATLTEEQRKLPVGTPPPTDQDAVTGAPLAPAAAPDPGPTTSPPPPTGASPPAPGVAGQNVQPQQTPPQTGPQVPPERPPLDPANVAAAEALAASADEKADGPAALELQKMIEAWFDGLVGQLPAQEGAITEKLLAVVTPHGARLADVTDVGVLNSIIEELSQYEDALKAAVA